MQERHFLVPGVRGLLQLFLGLLHSCGKQHMQPVSFSHVSGYHRPELCHSMQTLPCWVCPSLSWSPEYPELHRVRGWQIRAQPGVPTVRERPVFARLDTIVSTNILDQRDSWKLFPGECSLKFDECVWRLVCSYKQHEYVLPATGCWRHRVCQVSLHTGQVQHSICPVGHQI